MRGSSLGPVNGSHRLRALVVPAGDNYGLARVVVAVRAAVVLSIVVLVATGPEWVRRYPVALAVVLAAALGYAVVLMAHPRYEVRRTRFAWPVAVLDALFTLTLIGLTGGAASPVVAVLALAVIASAARLTFVECLILAVLLGTAYAGVVVWTTVDGVALEASTQGLWWALYMVFIAVLGGGLAVLIEREHRSRVDALVEAEAEHAAAQEERDLRARLLRSYEAQQEGLQVLLHEFRTPVASLDALVGALSDTATPMPVTDRDAAVELAGRHTRHLSEMLDALSDVNLSRQPAFSSGRVRRVDVAELTAEAAHAVGLAPPRLQMATTGDVSAVLVDAQGLRRVLTNLLENAARHGRDLPIEVVCERAGGDLRVAVLDSGPGVPPAALAT